MVGPIPPAQKHLPLRVLADAERPCGRSPYAPGKAVQAAAGRREASVLPYEAGVPRQSEHRRSGREEDEEVEVEPHARRTVR